MHFCYLIYWLCIYRSLNRCIFKLTQISMTLKILNCYLEKKKMIFCTFDNFDFHRFTKLSICRFISYEWLIAGILYKRVIHCFSVDLHSTLHRRLVAWKCAGLQPSLSSHCAFYPSFRPSFSPLSNRFPFVQRFHTNNT